MRPVWSAECDGGFVLSQDPTGKRHSSIGPCSCSLKQAVGCEQGSRAAGSQPAGQLAGQPAGQCTQEPAAVSGKASRAMPASFSICKATTAQHQTGEQRRCRACSIIIQYTMDSSQAAEHRSAEQGNARQGSARCGKEARRPCIRV